MPPAPLALLGIVLLMNANAIGGQIFFCNVVLKNPMLMGRSKFYGVSPADPFCGLPDTKL